ncbi:hypothetical protein L0657_26600 [Dyadobacter sp. CY345]|uniref:hypothetical protein n=1 Tax=Dyadobacter sp. CY345 TaxID=2909335 RepID=UPI001F1E784A|nr:hypothetical protein [Dyadobacter sp. CY345]MCF2447554.1 hypothetical protein [Dyadobacter sp. CY345]
MNLESFETNHENLLMAQTDLAVLKDLFHSLNDAGISYSSLNCSIALLEKYIENACVLTPDFETSPNFIGTNYAIKNSQVWRKSNRTFAYQQF